MFKVPIDDQCAILVFHAASHPQCEQLPRNAREIARTRPACEERRADAWLPIGNRTTKGSSEILPYDASVIVTTNLPFEEWKEVLGGERLREARRRRRGRRPGGADRRRRGRWGVV